VWVFSNEIDTARTPLTALQPGEIVTLCDSGGTVLGSAYVNPHSLICARLFSRRAETRLDRELLERRLRVALTLRERLFHRPYYRLAFGESDNLPGLVIDRFGAVFVVQITTAAMEHARDDIVAALDALFAPQAVVLRNDTGIRALEGLEQYVATPLGKCPESVAIEENGAGFAVAPLSGQKTGWYFDHRQNRARMAAYVKDARVLDLFSYCGAWGIQAALTGAQEVLCIDDSTAALEAVRHNAELNDLSSRVSATPGDAFEVLRTVRDERRRFEVIILDPPAFIKRKKDLKAGVDAYRRVNQLAMQVLAEDGWLITSSCSFHMSAEMLMRAVLQAGRQIGRQLQIVEQGHQAADHPVHPAIAETNYLKTFFVRVHSGG
jgi:23S rRNA (cytosine1962-C5)-methyltransferase